MDKLPESYGAHFSYEVRSETRHFAQVEDAAIKAGIKHEHMPEHPSTKTAISRAIAYLMRSCMSNIEFPSWSKYANWETEQPIYRVQDGSRVQTAVRTVKCSGRNPNYSLKITEVKQLKTDTGQMWRINIANRNLIAENLGHALSVVYDPYIGVHFKAGTDADTFEEFGKELQEIVGETYKRFASQYNDEDIRSILDAELAEMKALKIIKNTNRFIAHEHVERAKLLYAFAEECGQVVSFMGLDKSSLTRDSLLKDLCKSIFDEMDEFEEGLDKRLTTTPAERKRGEKGRERLYNTATKNLDEIIALAQYHQACLGVVADGLKEREEKLRKKCHQFLTQDLDNTPQLMTMATDNTVNVENAFE